MNKEMMFEVANAIDNELEKFDMTDWAAKRPTMDCGTIGCVAGFAVHLKAFEDYKTFVKRRWMVNTGKDYHDIPYVSLEDSAREILGLSHDDARTLFHGYGVYGDLRTIQNLKNYVPTALRWMAENDRVDWKTALEEAGAPAVRSEEMSDDEDTYEEAE